MKSLVKYIKKTHPESSSYVNDLLDAVSEHGHEEDVETLLRWCSLHVRCDKRQQPIPTQWFSRIKKVCRERVLPFHETWDEVIVPGAKKTLNLTTTAEAHAVLSSLIKPFAVRHGVNEEWRTDNSFHEFVLKIPDAVDALRCWVGIVATVISSYKEFTKFVEKELDKIASVNEERFGRAVVTWRRLLEKPEKKEFPAGALYNILNFCNYGRDDNEKTTKEGGLLFSHRTQVLAQVTTLEYPRAVLEAVGECWSLLPSKRGGWALFNLLTFQDTRRRPDLFHDDDDDDDEDVEDGWAPYVREEPCGRYHEKTHGILVRYPITFLSNGKTKGHHLANASAFLAKSTENGIAFDTFWDCHQITSLQKRHPHIRLLPKTPDDTSWIALQDAVQVAHNMGSGNYEDLCQKSEARRKEWYQAQLAEFGLRDDNNNNDVMLHRLVIAGLRHLAFDTRPHPLTVLNTLTFPLDHMPADEAGISEVVAKALERVYRTRRVIPQHLVTDYLVNGLPKVVKHDDASFPRPTFIGNPTTLCMVILRSLPHLYPSLPQHVLEATFKTLAAALGLKGTENVPSVFQRVTEEKLDWGLYETLSEEAQKREDVVLWRAMISVYPHLMTSYRTDNRVWDLARFFLMLVL